MAFVLNTGGEPGIVPSFLVSSLLFHSLFLFDSRGGAVVWSAPYTTLYVFGDSLIDRGNLFRASHFTNGLNYADRLASNLGLTAMPSLAGGTNFAFGGARTDWHPLNQADDILSQVDAFQARFFQPDSNALFVVLLERIIFRV